MKNEINICEASGPGAVNFGGSGSSPLRREIGLGKAEKIDEIEIRWHGSGEVQTFRNVVPDQFYKIAEGKNELVSVKLKKIIWTLPDKTMFAHSTEFHTLVAKRK